ncbi:MAG: hypothetical protein ACOC5K_02370 [Chloroflexota bacterium]
MKLLPHVAASSAVGAGVWVGAGEPLALPAAVAAGVLPDADHLLDYYFRFIRRDRRFLFLPLHGWEYLAALALAYALLAPTPWMLAVVLGYATQIVGDQLVNDVRWHTYFITARAWRGFRIARVLDHREPDLGYEAFVNAVPFGKARVRRWFEERS